MFVRSLCISLVWKALNAIGGMSCICVEKPGQSAAGYHARKTRVAFVSYHVVLTALTINSLALSIYAVNHLGVTDGSPLKPHPVDPNINYRMWSLVGMPNLGLMVLNPSGSNFYWNGSFNGGGSGQSLSAVTTSALNGNDVSPLFNEGGQQYVLTADTTTQNGVLASPYVSGPFPPNSRFTYDYYWSFSFFRYSLENTKFLGCDSTWHGYVKGWDAGSCVSKPSSAVYPQRNLNLECHVALDSFANLIEKGNDDVTKTKFQ